MKPASGSRVRLMLVEAALQLFRVTSSARVCPAEDRRHGAAFRTHADETMPEAGDGDHFNARG